MNTLNISNRFANAPRYAPPVPVVYVVDEDCSLRTSLEMQIRLEGWQPETFASAAEFLECPWTSVPSCLVLDANLPSRHCLDIQRHIMGERPDMPIILTDDRNQVAMTVQAMKTAEFLMKSSDGQPLLSALRWGVAHSALALEQKAALQALRERYLGLSHRQQQVMALVASGRLIKHISDDLGISEAVVKNDRRDVMHRMGANSPVDLMHLAARLRIAAPCSTGACDDDARPSNTGPYRRGASERTVDAAKIADRSVTFERTDETNIGALAPWQLRRAQELIAARLDATANIAEIAKQCGLSKGYFERAFAKSTGKPPHRWLRERRLERSKDLLMRSPLSIAEIALECGFADQSHLTRLFGSTVGMSPGRWRRMNKC